MLEVEQRKPSPGRGAGLAMAQTSAGAAILRARVSDAPYLACGPPTLLPCAFLSPERPSVQKG